MKLTYALTAPKELRFGMKDSEVVNSELSIVNVATALRLAKCYSKKNSTHIFTQRRVEFPISDFIFTK